MLPHVHNFIKDAIWILFTSRTYHFIIMTYKTLNKKSVCRHHLQRSQLQEEEKRKKLVIFCWMLGHVLFEMRGLST